MNSEILGQIDRTRKYHPECGNPIIKEYIWYALTVKWILAQKLRIPKILWVIGLCTDRLVSS